MHACDKGLEVFAPTNIYYCPSLTRCLASATSSSFRTARRPTRRCSTRALPPDMWKPGDTFIAAHDLRRFRIVEIGELENPDLEDVHAVWIVEPVDD
jgi:hypothetical protein